MPLYTIMQKVFGDLTLRRKLMSIIMLACTLSLFLVGSVFVFWQWFSLRQSMIRNLTTQAKVIADNCKASITFDEPKDAIDVLMAIKSESSIIFGGIYKINGDIFACYNSSDTDLIDEQEQVKLRQYGHVFDKDSLTVYVPVVVEDKDVGIVCLKSTLSELHSVLKRSIIVMVCALILVSILIYLVSSEMQKIISEPILDQPVECLHSPGLSIVVIFWVFIRLNSFLKTWWFVIFI